MSQAPKCVICGGNHTQREHFEMMRGQYIVPRDVVVINEPVVKRVTTQGTTPKIVPKETQPKGTTQGTTQKEKDRLKKAKWREKNREKYNEYMRDLRAKGKYSHLENMDGDGI